ncbi:glycosyltransferase family 2 protein [Kallotenue papyrolyticum]|uniref:glycosyltransferase family 2 protein n=1 Tax=Kallotenue papyrolyticum TaxID=1325125 RepID=UPI0004927B74|nr:glycosyltransferase family 2 protein [Kallotenue papyrolyticum]
MVQELLVQPAVASVAPRRWPFTVTIAMPAYNEGHGIAQVIAAVRAVAPEAEILVVDDCSTDDTAAQAEAAGARVIRHPYNKGNGAAVKTAIRNAGGEVLLILDADGQHDPADIPRLLEHMERYDMVVSVRDRTSHASRARGVGNWLLARFASYVAGMEFEDLTSGFRAMRLAAIREFVHLLPNRYSWPTTSLLCFAKAGYSIKFVPIAARRRSGGRSGQKLLRNGFKFMTIILRIVMLFSPLRVFFPVSLAMVILSLLAYLASVAVNGVWLKIPNATAALFVGAIVVFMFGLLAEQIVALGLIGRRD